MASYCKISNDGFDSMSTYFALLINKQPFCKNAIKFSLSAISDTFITGSSKLTKYMLHSNWWRICYFLTKSLLSGKLLFSIISTISAQIRNRSRTWLRKRGQLNLFLNKKKKHGCTTLLSSCSYYSCFFELNLSYRHFQQKSRWLFRFWANPHQI